MTGGEKKIKHTLLLPRNQIDRSSFPHQPLTILLSLAEDYAKGFKRSCVSPIGRKCTELTRLSASKTKRQTGTTTYQYSIIHNNQLPRLSITGKFENAPVVPTKSRFTGSVPGGVWSGLLLDGRAPKRRATTLKTTHWCNLRFVCRVKYGQLFSPNALSEGELRSPPIRQLGL